MNGWSLPFGASVVDGGVRFVVWAPAARRIDVLIGEDDLGTAYPLAKKTDGTHEGTVEGVGPGTRYRFRLDGGDAFPDPASRYQPDGPHGPSEVIDPLAHAWNDQDWPGLSPQGLVIYECHVGAMTPEGTFSGLTDQLPELTSLGVTAIELMPVADCPGRWNWGYDGVDLFAPNHAYGRPDDLKHLVDTAHGLGLGVLLDVVYNHLGPDGNYLCRFADQYFTDRHKTPWGDAVNYDGPGSDQVRSFMIANACYWLSEYHFDALRLDATDAIIDTSETHILAELTERARAAVAPRSVVIFAEQAANDVRLIQSPARGGYGLDAAWADDFHHQVRVFLSGERDGYLAEYRGTAEDVARTINGGFFFQGGPGQPRGTRVTDEPASAFVHCVQNHDQVGNRAFGDRLNHQIDLDRYHVASALLLFSPYTPLLFMGQEFAASSPFLFFTDHDPDLGKLVTEGRREEFKGFAAFADPTLRARIPDPQAPDTFFRSKLDLTERRKNAATYALYHELLRLRRADPVLAVQNRRWTRAAALGPDTVVEHRWAGRSHRLLIANFGDSARLDPAELPGMTDLSTHGWGVLFSTAERRFGRDDSATLVKRRSAVQVEVPARSATILAFKT